MRKQASARQHQTAIRVELPSSALYSCPLPHFPLTPTPTPTPSPPAPPLSVPAPHHVVQALLHAPVPAEVHVQLGSLHCHRGQASNALCHGPGLQQQLLSVTGNRAVMRGREGRQGGAEAGSSTHSHSHSHVTSVPLQHLHCWMGLLPSSPSSHIFLPSCCPQLTSGSQCAWPRLQSSAWLSSRAPWLWSHCQ